MKLKKIMAIAMLIAISAVSCSKENLLKAENTKNEDTVYPVIKQDSLALVALYDATGGDNWYKPHNWRTTQPIENWYGVDTKIIDGKRRVVSLRMVHWNMTGRIPNEIKDLTELRVLDFGYNDSLSGAIPEAVYELKNLVTLKMKFTKFEGELSPSIGKLTQLDTLDLWASLYDDYTYNENSTTSQRGSKYVMSGKLPKELGNLKNLRYMVLGRHNFTGEIPEEIGNMTSINHIDLADCKLSGKIPNSIGNLKNLELIFLCNNQLNGEIPAEICNSTKLETLLLNNNNLTGNIPSLIGNLKRLNHFDVHNNMLSGEIPTSILENENLGLLYLQNNQFSGSIPQGLGNMHPKMVYADFSNNNFTGTLPSQKGHLTSLGELRYITFKANNNMLSGTLPDNYVRHIDEAKANLLPQQKGYSFSNLK